MRKITKVVAAVAAGTLIAAGVQLAMMRTAHAHAHAHGRDRSLLAVVLLGAAGAPLLGGAATAVRALLE